jgi:hypothetical protein
VGDGTNLYVGGGFATAGGITANRIAKWDGANWSPVGSDSSVTVFGEVHAIALAGTNLYIGGTFSFFSPTTANYVARWDGAHWTALGAGLDGTVTSLAAIGSDLYVGGMFANAAGIRANHIAKWDGANWSLLGSGAGPSNSEVDALAASGGALYVGGTFTSAGQTPSSYFGIWHPPGSAPVSLEAPVFSQATATIVINWNSQPGQTYQVLSTTNLSQPFAALGGLIPAGGATTSYTNSTTGENGRFFRIKQ